jgi:hypothetical protein
MRAQYHMMLARIVYIKTRQYKQCYEIGDLRRQPALRNIIDEQTRYRVSPESRDRFKHCIPVVLVLIKHQMSDKLTIPSLIST